MVGHQSSLESGQGSDNHWHASTLASIRQTLAASGVNTSQETLKPENYGSDFPPIVENNDLVDSNSRERWSQTGTILITMGWSSIPVSSPNSTSSKSTTQTTSSTSSHKDNGFVREGVLRNTKADICMCLGNQS